MGKAGRSHELHRAEEKSPGSAFSCLAALLKPCKFLLSPSPLPPEGQIGGIKLACVLHSFSTEFGAPGVLNCPGEAPDVR